MGMYVIYDHPEDFPDHYVARYWQDGKKTGIIWIYESLADLRRDIRNMGYQFCLMRNETDNPVIVETWI